MASNTPPGALPQQPCPAAHLQPNGRSTSTLARSSTARLGPIPTSNIRKMRWTYSAGLQPGEFQRSDFDVAVSSWTVAGANRVYAVSGVGSRRIENDLATLSGIWSRSEGNFSAGSIHLTTSIGSTASIAYDAQTSHELYLGTRRTDKGGIVEVSVDGGPVQTFDLFVPAEDYLARLHLGSLAAGPHTVAAELIDRVPASPDNAFYFDFVEIATPSTTLDAHPSRPRETLATDWDTDHSLVLPPERVAWNLDMLGFHGRANHYAGAILFYELENPANVFAQRVRYVQRRPSLQPDCSSGNRRHDIQPPFATHGYGG